MNILNLPKYVETPEFTAWRNTWARRELGYPFVGYFIKRGGEVIEIWARPNTELEPFFEHLERLDIDMAEGLAYHVTNHGIHGYLRGTYILKVDDLLITLDALEGANLNFVLYLNGKELMLSLPRSTSIMWLIALLRHLEKKERDGRG